MGFRRETANQKGWLNSEKAEDKTVGDREEIIGLGSRGFSLGFKATAENYLHNQKVKRGCNENASIDGNSNYSGTWISRSSMFVYEQE